MISVCIWVCSNCSQNGERSGSSALTLPLDFHSNLHPSRLGRDFSGRFGSKAYAFEELVAELASTFAQAALGIRADIEHHTSYIESWQLVLKQDRYAFVKACTLDEAVEYSVSDEAWYPS